jgi:hypothetical protein
MAKGRDNRNREEKKKKKPRKDKLEAPVSAPPLSFQHHSVVRTPERTEG